MFNKIKYSKKKKRRLLLLTIILVSFFISVGYAAFNLKLSVSGTAKISSPLYDLTMSGSNVTFTPATTKIHLNGETVVTATPSACYYFSNYTCTNGYTTNLNTSTDSSAAQNIVVSNNNKAYDSTCTVTMAKVSIQATANGYTGTYDGSSHKGSVTSSTSGVTIKYGTTSGTYTTTTMPSYTDAGDHTVYYQITRSGCTAKTGNIVVSIAKRNDSITIKKATYTKGNTAVNPTYTVTSGRTPTVTYYSDSACASSLGSTIPSNVGVYYAKASVPTSTNYNSYTTSCTEALVIQRAVALTGGIYYPSLNAAYNKVTTSDPNVKLVDNTSESSTVPEGKVVVLNLNGKSITYNNEGAPLKVIGTLTVNGTGNVTSGYAYAIHVTKTGTLTVNGGVYQGKHNGIMHVGSGVVTVNAGTFTGVDFNGASIQTGGTLIINGGTFNGNIQGVDNYTNGSIVKIGGTSSNPVITGKKYGIYNCADCKTYVCGGNIKSSTGDFSVYNAGGTAWYKNSNITWGPKLSYGSWSSGSSNSNCP